MDCRTFHARHVGFVDDILPGIEVVEMQRHMAECALCARHDARIRRSLLVFRNMPTIECSPGFTERVTDRIRTLDGIPLVTTRSDFVTPRGAFTAAIAAGLVAIAGWGFVSDAEAPLSHPPVVAMVPAEEPSAEESLVASHAMLASVSTGIPIWPAALMVEQAENHFTNSAIRLANLTR